MPAGGSETIQGLCKMLAGLLLASGQHTVPTAITYLTQAIVL